MPSADYPYTKLDVAEAPLGKHGMEYPALVLIGSDVYRTERLKLEPLVVHETAHQWWYNLVGSDPVASPAIDESLAEYSLLDVLSRASTDAAAPNKWWKSAGPSRPESAKAAGLDAPVEQRGLALYQQ